MAGSSHCPTPFPRNAEPAANGCRPIPKRVPGKAQSRSEMSEAELRDAARHSLISGIDQTSRHLRVDDGLLTGNKGSLTIGGIGRGRLDVPAQTEIQREAAGDPPVILHEYGRGPRVGRRRDRLVLPDRIRNPQQEVGETVTGNRAVEGEISEIVQIGELFVFVERLLTAEAQIMLTLHHADQVAQRVIIIARQRTLNLLAQRKVAIHHDVRQVRRALRLVGRAQVLQGGLRIANA